MIKSAWLIALLAVLVPALVSAQSIISELDEETTYSATLEVAVWDPSETNPFLATKRMALSLTPGRRWRRRGYDLR